VNREPVEASAAVLSAKRRAEAAQREGAEAARREAAEAGKEEAAEVPAAGVAA
jgi:hypothetical protein